MMHSSDIFLLSLLFLSSSLLSHYIDDSHALRMLATRLGASLTVALPFMVAVLAIPTLFGPNLQIADGLKPSFSLPDSFALAPFPNETNTFRKLTLGMRTQAFLSGLEKADGKTVACNDKEKGIILIDDSSSNLQCTQSSESSVVSETTGMIMCALTVDCEVTGSFSGTQDVTLKFPSSFQTIAWNATTSSWNNKNTTLAQVLHPSDNNILSGNEKTPSVLRFGALRSQKIDKSDPEKKVPDEYGIQLDWVGTQREESIDGSSETHHYVAFEFSVGDSVYVTESSQKLDLLTRFSTVLTLLLTVMSAMRFLKIYLEVGIDTYLVKKARKNGRNPPDDVLRRVRVLDEHAITGSGESMRRLSSSAAMLQNVNIDGDDDGPVNSTTIEMRNLGSDSHTGDDDDDDEDDELSEVSNSSLVNRLKRQVLKSKLKIAEANRKIAEANRKISSVEANAKRERDSSKRQISELKETLNGFMKHASYTPSNIPSNGEVKVADIKDEAPTKMHRNPHWKKLKLSVKTANKFRSSKSTASSTASSSSPDNKLGRKNRTKRLSKVMKSRRNSALEKNTKTEQAKSTATAAADELKVSPPPAPESLLLSVKKKRESLSSNP